MKLYSHTCLFPILFYCHMLTIFSSVFSFSLLQAYHLSNETDLLALLQIKQGITSDPNGVLSSWNGSNHFCNWSSVSCGHRHMRVVSLVLEGQNLKGLLSPYVGNLSFLRNLNLQNNSLHGQIPSEIGKLFRLKHLIVGNNSLNGEIPSNLSGCSHLEILVLQNNNLVGGIPQGLGSLSNLQAFALAGNNLTGEIPASLGNLTYLYFFSLGINNFVGNVPDELGRLKNMKSFFLSSNHLLSGTIPPSLFNISSLEKIGLTNNQFEGDLPYDIGLTLPNIQFFAIGQNHFSGSFPNSFVNATSLELIDLQSNKFTGQVPNTLGRLKHLRHLALFGNDLVTGSKNDWTFLASLTNCTSLELLDLSSNNFEGVLPNFIGNLSTQLNYLFLGTNRFAGTIPPTIVNLRKLVGLSIEENFLVGTIPSDLDKFQNLQMVTLAQNGLSGPLPSSIGNLTNLYYVDLSRNSLEGSITVGIKNCKRLQVLLISHNLLNGTIPELLPTYLTVLNLSGNFFTGHLPDEIGKLLSMNLLDFSENKLSGEIPRSIGECSSLEILHLQGNSLQGKIPPLFSTLKGLRNLDLSRNNLTGVIPTDLQNLSFALYLNLSFNDLEGGVPTGGLFRDVRLFSVAGNEKICGGVPELRLPKCSVKSTHKERHRVQKFSAIGASVVLFIVSMSAILVICYRRKKVRSNPTGPSFLTDPRVEVSYRDLHQATNGFSFDHLIGSGTFGLVYKGFLNQVERNVAIKVLKLKQPGASKSFMAECKALRSVRHRNLVKLLTYCSSLDYAGNEFKALIFEFMESGSLENQPRSLTFTQRLNIVIDVSSALHYLHELCEGPIIHCDLKPSNILLDENFVAHLSDFGLAKIFFSINDGSHSQISSIGMKGTIGYAPPEYGLGGVASKEGDVYSFGILVLELFSGKQPTHEMFMDGLNLHDFVKNSLPQALWDVMDPSMIYGETNREERTIASKSIIDRTNKLKESLLSIFRVGLACSAQNPIERQKIGDVVKELHLIKSIFLGARIYE